MGEEIIHEPFIELSGVHKRFESLDVLRGIDLAVQPGEKIVLIGASGCGKSTLLRCVNALESLDAGMIRVGERVLDNQTHRKRSFDLNAFRASIGIVFQDYNLFPHLTVLENLMIGPVKVKKIPKEQAMETGMRLLARVELSDKAKAFPEQLSGGQCQRVAIARALAMEPQVILFDEPTSALDPKMTRSVHAVIEDIANDGLTLMIVTHDIPFARRVGDRIVFLHAGQIVESGSPGEVLDHPQRPETQAFLSELFV